MEDKKENTGDRNTGNWNTGNWNTGNWNTGNWNTGYLNTGNWNTGDRNTGNWNTGDRNTGYLNTTQPKVRLFNKETDLEFDDISFPEFFYFDLTKWIYSSEMTDEEKAEHPLYETTDGYLKKYDYKEQFIESWNNAAEDDKAKLFELPNFDAGIFKEISGIDVNEEKREKVDVGGTMYYADDLAKLKPAT